jgi:hypothetical protein
MRTADGREASGRFHTWAPPADEDAKALGAVCERIRAQLPCTGDELRVAIEGLRDSPDGTLWKPAAAALTALWRLGLERLNAKGPTAESSSPGVTAFGSGVFLGTSVEGARNVAQRWAEEGLVAGKVRIGRGLGEDIATFGAVRDVVGSKFTLIADCVFGFSFDEAARRMEAYSEFDFQWFESPLAETTIDDLKRLRSHGRVGAGDKLRGRDALLALAHQNAVDVLVVDPVNVGGAFEMEAILKQCADSDLEWATHLFPSLGRECVLRSGVRAGWIELFPLLAEHAGESPVAYE